MITTEIKFVTWMNQWRVSVLVDGEYDRERWFATEDEARTWATAQEG